MLEKAVWVSRQPDMHSVIIRKAASSQPAGHRQAENSDQTAFWKPTKRTQPFEKPAFGKATFGELRNPPVEK